MCNFIKIFFIFTLFAGSSLLRAQDDIVKNAEKFINEIKNLKADFEQQNPDGSVSRGNIYISRPGRMRIVYAPPSKLEIIANGTWLIQHDPIMNETSHITLRSTPAGFLLSDKLDINAGMQVVNTKSDQKETVITLAPKSDNNFRQLEIRFETSPFRLEGWSVEDFQGNITTVKLTNLTRPTELNPRLFVLEKF